jgi:flagellar biosynthesis protein FlhB
MFNELMNVVSTTTIMDIVKNLLTLTLIGLVGYILLFI